MKKTEVLHLLTLKEQGWKKNKKINEHYFFLEKDGIEIKVSKESGTTVSKKSISEYKLSP